MRACGGIATEVKWYPDLQKGNITKVSHNVAFAQKEKAPFLGSFLISYFPVLWGTKGEEKKNLLLTLVLA